MPNTSTLKMNRFLHDVSLLIYWKSMTRLIGRWNSSSYFSNLSKFSRFCSVPAASTVSPLLVMIIPQKMKLSKEFMSCRGSPILHRETRGNLDDQKRSIDLVWRSYPC